MKKLVIYVIMFLLLGCGDEANYHQEKKNGHMQFSFSKRGESNGGRSKELAVPAFVLLNIKDLSNASIEENKKIPVYTFGNEYVSESFPLNVGNYKLTQFMILDASNDVIYATPMEGSLLEQYVDDPLPINFSITENGTTLVTPQVLDVTEQNTPEAFGYVSFGFEIIHHLSMIEIQEDNSFAKFTYVYGMDSVDCQYYSCYPTLDNCLKNGRTVQKYSDKLLTEEIYYQNSMEIEAKYTFEYNPDRSLSKAHIKQVDNVGYTINFYYKQNGQVDYANRSLSNYTNGARQHFKYEYSNDGKDVTIFIHHLNNNNTLGALIVKQEFKMDSKENPLRVFSESLSWTSYGFKNNVIWARFTEYYQTGTVMDVAEMYFNYEYNVFGLPDRMTISNPSNSYYAEHDGTIKTYQYK